MRNTALAVLFFALAFISVAQQPSVPNQSTRQNGLPERTRTLVLLVANVAQANPLILRGLESREIFTRHNVYKPRLTLTADLDLGARNLPFMLGGWTGVVHVPIRSEEDEVVERKLASTRCGDCE